MQINFSSLESTFEKSKFEKRWTGYDSKKILVSPYDGMWGDVTNPKHWSNYGFSKRFAVREKTGIGIVLSKLFDSGKFRICCIDLDDHVKDGVIDKFGLEILELFGNTYSEFSQSGNGVHILFYAKKETVRCKKLNLGFEIYDNLKFIALTGNTIPGFPLKLEYRQKECNEICKRIFGNSQKQIEDYQIPNELKSLTPKQRKELNFIHKHPKVERYLAKQNPKDLSASDWAILSMLIVDLGIKDDLILSHFLTEIESKYMRDGNIEYVFHTVQRALYYDFQAERKSWGGKQKQLLSAKSKSENCKRRIRKAKRDLKSQGKMVSKTAVSMITGLSRNTVIKYW